MRNIIAHLIYGLIVFVNQSLTESQVTAQINDGTTYSVESLVEGSVATDKDIYGNAITWASGPYTLVTSSSSCSTGNCKHVGFEVQYDSTNGELYLPYRPGDSGMLGMSTTNTCTGDKCSACSFTWTPDHKHVTGCHCDEGPGICNHTIQTTTN